MKQLQMKKEQIVCVAGWGKSCSEFWCNIPNLVRFHSNCSIDDYYYKSRIKWFPFRMGPHTKEEFYTKFILLPWNSFTISLPNISCTLVRAALDLMIEMNKIHLVQMRGGEGGISRFSNEVVSKISNLHFFWVVHRLMMRTVR